MKKLMIAAAIVCAAVVSQGAACAWSQKGSEGIGDSAGYDWMPTDTAVYLLTTGTAQDDLVKGLTGAGYESTVAAAKIAKGAIMDEGALSNPMGTTTLAPELSNIQAYYVLFDGDNMFVSDAQAMTWVSGGDGKYKVEFADANASASWTGEVFDAKDGFQGAGWYQASAVPEPTSGLLLLLGVAGLALRRRRA